MQLRISCAAAYIYTVGQVSRRLSGMLSVTSSSSRRASSCANQFLDVFQRNATYTSVLYSSSQPSSAQPAHDDSQVHAWCKRQAQAAH